MDSGDKAFATFVASLAIFGAVAVIMVNVKAVFVEVEYAKAGLQQCVVKVGLAEVLAWQKECNK
jgi:hypothetical protein